MGHLRLKWDPCIINRGNDVQVFIEDYFSTVKTKVCLIAGAGFDPRTPAICTRLVQVVLKLVGIFIQEERPNPNKNLITLADENIRLLEELLPDHVRVPIDIFGVDNAVVGGRNIVKVINEQNFSGVSDVVIDISALSIGTSFPMIRYFVERINKPNFPKNLHIFVTQNPQLDESIVRNAGDTVSTVHGFPGKWKLDSSSNAAKLWLPQLAHGRKVELQRIYNVVEPHDTCPIIPFPSVRPRHGEELIEQYLNELESAWAVDTRNIIYAAEDDPLDLYRTILKIGNLREQVFEGFGGSLMVLTPSGSKVLALGGLMAALERDIPVVYLEAMGYDYSGVAGPDNKMEVPEFIHIWLIGDACPA